jgi:uncharacterized protein YqhQ
MKRTQRNRKEAVERSSNREREKGRERERGILNVSVTPLFSLLFSLFGFFLLSAFVCASFIPFTTHIAQKIKKKRQREREKEIFSSVSF